MSEQTTPKKKLRQEVAAARNGLIDTIYEKFVGADTMPPILLIVTKDDVSAFSPWEIGVSQGSLYMPVMEAMAEAALHVKGDDVLGFVTAAEAWQAVIPKEELKEVDINNLPSASKHPNRKEIITVGAYDRGGAVEYRIAEVLYEHASDPGTVGPFDAIEGTVAISRFDPFGVMEGFDLASNIDGLIAREE